MDSHFRFGVQDGVIADEDITIEIKDNLPQELSPLAIVPVYYRIGSDSVPNWYKKEANTCPLIKSLDVVHFTGQRVAYNTKVSDSWVLQSVPNNQFVLAHILATNDIQNPIVCVLGNTYNTKSQARENAKTELNQMQGLPFLEFVKLGTVIYETSDSYQNTYKAKVVSTEDNKPYVDLRTLGTSLF